MKTRRQNYGTVNKVGKNIEALRKAAKITRKDFIAQMQVLGCDINPSSYSKLEGQLRIVTDTELKIIAQILKVPIDALFEEQ